MRDVNHWREFALRVAVAVLVWSGSMVAVAATRSWTDSNGFWSVAGNWSPSGVPGTGDDVNIIGASIFNFTVTYDYTGSAVTLNSLTVDQAGTAFVTHGATLSMAANNLSATSETIGDSSNGGSNGRGTFTQSGGVNHANDGAIGIIGLGEKSSDLGTYNLSGNASLQVDNTEFLGDFGSGTVNQTGGSNSCPNVVLGNNTGSSGSYSLSGGNLSAEQIAIGANGTGTFTQSGGLNTLQGVGTNHTALLIGAQSTANNSYTLNSGTLTVAGDESVGDGGMGTFNQTGGTHTLAFIQTPIGDLAGNLYVGNSSGAVGAYTLSGTAKLELAGDTEFIGYSGAGTFTQSGGTNTLDNGPLVLGNNANSSGTYNLSGGTLDSSQFGLEKIGLSGTANFNQSGGTNNSIDLTLAVNSSASASYTLTAGALNLDRDLEIGALGTGTFTQSGGTATISSEVDVGSPNSSGSLSISGTGQFSVTGLLMVYHSSTGGVTVSGGALSAGSLTNDGAVTVDSGTVTVGAATLSSTSTLSIGLGGNTRGADFGAVVASGSVSLNGALQVSLINGFTPALGDTFDILDWGSLTGKFSSIVLPDLNNGPLGWDTSHLYTTGVLTVTDTVVGDFNRDGHVDVADIQAMEQALSDLPDYQSAKGLTAAQLLAIGDVNRDGVVNNLDIQAEISLIANMESGLGSISTVPEPATFSLMAFGAVALIIANKKTA